MLFIRILFLCLAFIPAATGAVDTATRFSTENNSVIYPQLLPQQQLKVCIDRIHEQAIPYSDSLVQALWLHYQHNDRFPQIKKCHILEGIRSLSMGGNDTVNVVKAFRELMHLDDSISNKCKPAHIVNQAYYLITHLKYREGMQLLKKAQQLIEEGIGDRRHMHGICLLLSHCNFILNDTADSRKYALQALGWAKKTNDSITIIKAYMDLATFFTYKDKRQSRSYFDSALAYAQHSNYYKVGVYNEYIVKLLDERREKEVRDLMPVYLQLFNSHPFDERLHIFHTNMMVSYHYYMGHNDQDLLRSVTALNQNFRRFPLHFMEHSVYQNNALIYMHLNKPDSAYYYMKKYVEKKKILRNELNKNDLNTLQYNYELSQKQRRVNVSQLKLAAMHYEQQKKTSIIALSLATLLTLCCIGCFYYIRSKKKHQKLSLKLQQESQKLLYNRISTLISGEDRERQRVAEELHDNVGSILAMAHYSLPSIAGTDSRQAAGQLQQNLKKLSDTVRDFSHKLHPRLLLKSSMPEGIARISQMCANDATCIQYTHYGAIPSLPENVQINVYRIVQIILDQLLEQPSVRHINLSSLAQNQELQINFDWQFTENNIGDWESILFNSNTLQHRIVQTKAHCDWDICNQQIALFITIPIP